MDRWVDGWINGWMDGMDWMDTDQGKQTGGAKKGGNNEADGSVDG